MPVDQTGETILFVLDGAEVEVHISIAYDPDTDASQFAWVVPVTALPEFSVGSQQLFGNLLAGTVPSYGVGNYFESCGGSFGEDGDFCDGTGAGDGFDESGGDKLDLGPSEPPPPEVVLHTTVGAFEVFVLDGGTVEGVMQWLGDNGFQQDPAAEPILDEYLTEGHLFVAFRLTTDAEASEIHPITLRIPTTEPCVPIRLTRIAAKEDMDIRAFFLADGRVSSLNWRHVTLNPLKLDWIGLGANYREVVTMAVDEPGADGHAWVTEYAGGSELVPLDGILGEAWDSLPFETASPEAAVQLLVDQALWGYPPGTGECGPLNPLVGALVASYLPVPPDVPLSYLCENPAGYAAAVDPLAWDGPAFAAELQQRVIDPAVHATELLQTWPYLTRLYTTISPGEMNEDPMFHPTPGLPDVTDLVQLGTVNNFCDGDTSFSLPDARLVALLDSSSWPDIAPEQMPWVETIEYLPADGAPVIEVDHRELIQGLLDAWNAVNGPPRSPISAACGEDSTGGLTVGSSDDTSGGAGIDDGLASCDCRSTGGGHGSIVLVGLGLLGLRRRRIA